MKVIKNKIREKLYRRDRVGERREGRDTKLSIRYSINNNNNNNRNAIRYDERTRSWTIWRCHQERSKHSHNGTHAYTTVSLFKNPFLFKKSSNHPSLPPLSLLRIPSTASIMTTTKPLSSPTGPYPSGEQHTPRSLRYEQVPA
jgi:hypothetical protein